MPIVCPCYHQSVNEGHNVNRHDIRERHYVKDKAHLDELERDNQEIPPELTLAIQQNQAITATKEASRSKRSLPFASSSSTPVSAVPSPSRPPSSSREGNVEGDSDSEFDELISPDERELPFFPKVPPPKVTPMNLDSPHSSTDRRAGLAESSSASGLTKSLSPQAVQQHVTLSSSKRNDDALSQLASLLTRESAGHKEQVRVLEARLADLERQLAQEREAMRKEREEFTKERQLWYSDAPPPAAAAAARPAAVAGPSTTAPVTYYASSPPPSLSAQSLYTSVVPPPVIPNVAPHALKQYVEVVEHAHAPIKSKWTFENPSPDVIWTTKDIKRVLGRSESSHTFGVAPEQIIRDHHGVQVPNARFVEIQGDLIRRLAPLEAKFKPTAKFERANLKYFDTFHREELDTVCMEAEGAYPELALCQAHFKARFIIMKYFIKLRMSTYDKKRRRLADSTIAKLTAAGKSIEDRGHLNNPNKRPAIAASPNASKPSRSSSVASASTSSASTSTTVPPPTARATPTPASSTRSSAPRASAASKAATPALSTSFIHKYKSV